MVKQRDSEEIGAPCEPLRLTYESPEEYKSIVSDVIQAQQNADFAAVRREFFSSISVKWFVDRRNKKITASFHRPEGCRISEANRMRLVLNHWPHEGDVWEEDGIVEKVIPKIGVFLSFYGPATVEPGPWDVKHGFELHYNTCTIPYERMTVALSKFVAARSGPNEEYIRDKVLNWNNVPTQVSRRTKPVSIAAKAPKLNTRQDDAVRHASTTPLALIHGPPGTGKTITAAAFIYDHLRDRLAPKDDKILVSAPSNIAVDRIASVLHAWGVRVVRLYARHREKGDFAHHPNALHKLVEQRLQCVPEGKDIMRLRDKQYLDPKEKSKLNRLLHELSEDIITSQADVVCATCVGSGDQRLRSFTFSTVLIDEAGQATEPEILCPLSYGAKHVVLVGDHLQLCPMTKSPKVAQLNITRSLFARLVEVGVEPCMLDVQYRMHPKICEWPSMQFYHGGLKSGITAEDRTDPTTAHVWPNPACPVYFYHCPGSEETLQFSKSKSNPAQRDFVVAMVQKLLAAGVPAGRIGVITPYEAQSTAINDALLPDDEKEVERLAAEGNIVQVANVDGFQGQEKDYIIFSTVRSNKHNDLGFLRDARRLNVSLTRARYGMIVCGDAEFLANCERKKSKNLTDKKIWFGLLQHYKAHNLIREGDMMNTKPMSNLNLREDIWDQLLPEITTKTPTDLVI